MKRIVLSLLFLCCITSVMAQTDVSGEVEKNKQNNFRHSGFFIELGDFFGPKSDFIPVTPSYYFSHSDPVFYKFYDALQLSFGYQFGPHFSMSLTAFVDMWSFQGVGHYYSYSYYNVYTHSTEWANTVDKEYPIFTYKPFHPGVAVSFKYYLLNRKITPYIGFDPGVYFDFWSKVDKEKKQINTTKGKKCCFNSKLYIGLSERFARIEIDEYLGWNYIPIYPESKTSSFLFGTNIRFLFGRKTN